MLPPTLEVKESSNGATYLVEGHKMAIVIIITVIVIHYWNVVILLLLISITLLQLLQDPLRRWVRIWTAFRRFGTMYSRCQVPRRDLSISRFKLILKCFLLLMHSQNLLLIHIWPVLVGPIWPIVLVDNIGYKTIQVFVRFLGQFFHLMELTNLISYFTNGCLSECPPTMLIAI